MKITCELALIYIIFILIGKMCKQMFFRWILIILIISGARILKHKNMIKNYNELIYFI